jgi:hypothetical protein
MLHPHNQDLADLQGLFCWKQCPGVVSFELPLKDA